MPCLVSGGLEILVVSTRAGKLRSFGVWWAGEGLAAASTGAERARSAGGAGDAARRRGAAARVAPAHLSGADRVATRLAGDDREPRRRGGHAAALGARHEGACRSGTPARVVPRGRAGA